jgi:predicted alpha/beta-hydrolase family hydrolase
MDAEPVNISVGDEQVSGLLLRPTAAKALYLFAHGAGAGMTHSAMESNAQGLAQRGIATLRYQLPYMEKGSRRPDPPRIAHSAVRAAAAGALKLEPSLPLFAGGRSFGGRMTSQAQAIEPLSLVRGLAFLGFPLHPAGKPGTERADHLVRVKIPMLFVSGDHDALAELDLLRPLVSGLELATLHLVAHADHSLKVPAKSGRTAADAEGEALDAMADWMMRL